jgi:hypothetical protein
MRTKYLSVKDNRAKLLHQFPSAGPIANIKGMKSKFWGKNALVVKCGYYIYNVSADSELYYSI